MTGLGSCKNGHNTNFITALLEQMGLLTHIISAPWLFNKMKKTFKLQKRVKHMRLLKGKEEFDSLANENVQTERDKVAFHHALGTDSGGGAAILFSTRAYGLPTYSPHTFQRLTVFEH